MNSNLPRRNFLKSLLALSGLSLSAGASCRSGKEIKGSILGANVSVGHLLRDNKYQSVIPNETADVIIIGGGVSGLSAARWLSMHSNAKVVLLELDDKAGGNAVSGSNELSQFPLGAHYIPIPNNDLQEYLDFLQSSNVITAYNQEHLPMYNDQYLCHDPEERLYINGKWQDGLIPAYGISKEDQEQLADFLRQMDVFRYAKGEDGKDAFAIPVNASSKDSQYQSLDQITMSEWLRQQQYNSKYLQWYVNYCMLDDFGTPVEYISAWAGIHYFAGRKGKGVDVSHQDVLTWEEGNYFLIKKLIEQTHAHIRTGTAALNIISGDDSVNITYINTKDKAIQAISCKHCIVAVPQFVAARLLQNEHPERIAIVQQEVVYAPWIVANIKTNNLPMERRGQALSWDNVIYDSVGLGYVNACHQQLRSYHKGYNLTYYRPLAKGDAIQARQEAYTKKYEQWREEVLADLEIVHPDIRDISEQIDVMVWGHAMAQPLPGWISGEARQHLSADLHSCIHFAHTDIAGISIFEEGFYQGIEAAKEIISSLSA